MTSQRDAVPDRLETAATLAGWLVDLFGGPLAQGVLDERPDSCVLPAARGGSSIAALESERVRLFVNAPGGVPVPPYGSWWTESTLCGEIAATAAAMLREDGLELEPGAGPADAIPVCLEYLRFLLQHQRAAHLTRQPQLERAARSREQRFLAEVLDPWIAPFCRAVRDATREPFWSEAASVLESFVAAERERVST